jgi:UDP-N-acetylmuramate: L-alanyl-gamma-D-glutamyl-meso-diaminopimelate ligase
MSRGMPIVEELLNRRMPYTSGPAWLAEHILRDQWVIAVAGTHGKTTTTAMVAWLLESAGLEPGFLIGGVPANFPVSARLGGGRFFVIEADEYDTAFFDKRAKLLHYQPRTCVINNLEFDHADIYADMDAILWQFHQLIRMLPGNGRLITKAGDPEIDRLLNMGCWTGRERFTSEADIDADWRVGRGSDGEVRFAGEREAATVQAVLPGAHNLENACAAVLAARHAGVDLATAAGAFADWRGVKRRLEHLGNFAGVNVYDDFAHHPTAIRRTLAALRDGASGRVLAVLEPRSNTMKLGVHREELRDALAGADAVWAYQSPELPWSLAETLSGLPQLSVRDSIDGIVRELAAAACSGDEIVIMSNGGFGGIHAKLCAALATQ